MTRQKVDVIPASVRSVQNGGQLKSQTNIRVAAYCRVSTDKEDQLNSLDAQKRFFTEFTEKNGQRPHHPEARLDLCRHLRG